MSVIGWLFIILGTAFCVSVPLFLAVMAQEHREEQSSADVAREVLVPGMGGAGATNQRRRYLMTTTTITPLPHGPLRNAVEAGAWAVCVRAYRYADWLLRTEQRATPAGAAFLTHHLSHYRNLCALAGIEPQAHWVERITEAIEKGQA